MIGEMPEQVPYQEWLHSDYKDAMTCQACHMPVVQENVPITSVLGEPHPGFSRHVFVGGNFFMQRLMNLQRNDLAMLALPEDMDSAAGRTIAHLQSSAANLTIKSLEVRHGRLEAVISVENLTGHKLPTAYPSARMWLHVTVRDRDGQVLFESARSIQRLHCGKRQRRRCRPLRAPLHRDHPPGPGRDYRDSRRFSGQTDHGLLTAIGFLKDNRLLPPGFDKRTAEGRGRARRSGA